MRLVGIDVGGTFTDLVLFDSDRGAAIEVVKVPTTPSDPSEGVLTGLGELLRQGGIEADAVDLLSHGATIATNSLLEYKGARAGMITTRGFRDLVHLGRHQRPENYSIMQEIPWQDRPLVKRRYREVVSERLAPPNGDAIVPLAEQEVVDAARRLVEQGVDGIAICFLFSYLNPAHERRAKELVEETVGPDVFVTTSVDTVSQFREFERFTTTCINAFVGPAVKSYVERLDRALKDGGLRTPMHIMRSNGGVATAEAICEVPATTLLSGPAAGVIGGAWAGGNSARPNVITLDVGGTSSDIGIVTDGRAAEARARETRIAGYPALLPIIDLHTIGAGGGSIAHVDAGGAFRVGPASAGADPGPASYGGGGTDATVTDAHVVLGRLDPDQALGGRIRLQTDAARSAVQTIADELEIPLLEAAEGVLRVVNHSMVNAIRTKTIERGIDPREYTLVALGGAGPLHAADVAELLQIEEVIIPPFPGITSAMGLLTTDLRYDVATTAFLRSDTLTPADLDALFDRVEEDARSALARDGFADDDTTILRKLDCRYLGQGYELPIEVNRDPSIDVDSMFASFHDLHEREYGYCFRDNVIEIVTVRVTGVGSMPKIPAPSISRNGAGPLSPQTEREVSFRVNDELGGFTTPFYLRSDMHAGASIEGPAVVLQTDSTTVVPPQWAAEADESGNLLLRHSGQK
jgi:N-methylhydantoinase A